MQRSNGIVEMFLRDLNVGAEAQRVGAWRLALFGAVKFGESFVVILLFDERMNDTRASGLIVRLEDEIFAIGLGGFGLPFRVEGLGEAQCGDCGVWIGGEEISKFRFGVGGALELEI